MQIDTLNIKKATSIFFGLAVVIVAFLLISEREVFKADADTGDNLSGYAWSDTIGWISMNCTNTFTCSTSNYGVTVNGSGDLSGYAWSDNIGWVSFNASDVTSCPSGPCTPHMDTTTGVVTGWAKALAGGGPNAGGWDGFISLSGTANDGSPYGVTVNGCSWTGWAWGSTVVGWVNFAVSGKAGSCVALTGNAIQAQKCTISQGNATCNSDVMWNSVGFTAPNVRKNNPNTLISNTPSTGATPLSVPISFGTTTFELFDDLTLKASTSVVATCQAGTKWNGNTCALPTVTFEVCDASGNSCATSINTLVGNNTPLLLKWTSNGDSCIAQSGPGFAPSSLLNPIANTSITSSGILGATQYQILCQFNGALGPFGTLKTVTVNVTPPEPVLTADPRIVSKSGDKTKLSWDLKTYAGGCTLVGGTVNQTGLISNGSDPNVQIDGRTTFTLTCNNGLSDSVTVEVVPTEQET